VYQGQFNKKLKKCSPYAPHQINLLQPSTVNAFTAAAAIALPPRRPFKVKN